MESEVLQAEKETGVPPGAVPKLEARLHALRGRGRPLPATERTFFEPRFGHDFSRVRVHSGAEAAELAQAVHARAFTTGPDVVFGAGRYVPGTTAGRRLLAHELTHVVQQGSGGPGQPAAGGRERPPVRIFRSPESPADTGLPEDFGETGDTGSAEPLCGPDVTAELAGPASRVRSHLAGLATSEAKASCNALIALGERALAAWDIHDLQYRAISGEDSWLLDYQPDAAVGGEMESGQPRCEQSVTVNGSCHMPNTVNYYIFGVMCRACQDFLRGLPDEGSPEPGATEPVTAPPEPSPQFEHPPDMTPEEYVAAHTRLLKVDAGSLGSDLLLLAVLGPAHYDFIRQVFDELWSVTRDNVAWAFFKVASDETLGEIAGSPAGYDLILFVRDQMVGGFPSSGEKAQLERLDSLALQRPESEDTATDTGEPQEPADEARSPEEGDGVCQFGLSAPDALTRADAERFSKKNMLCVVGWYKDIRYGGARKEMSQAWAAAGFDNDGGASVPADADRAECESSSIPYDGPPFKVLWLPYLDE